jgi:hypothetical protein
VNEQTFYNREVPRVVDPTQPFPDATVNDYRSVPETVRALQAVEQGSRGIIGENALVARLGELTQGSSVPLVIFNCIGFEFSENGSYPQATPLMDAPSIAQFYARDITNIVNMLQQVGEPDVSILVPDSELDTRVLNIPMRDDELVVTRDALKGTLTDTLRNLPFKVELLSEYAKRFGLEDPKTYTESNYKKIKQEKKIKKSHVASERDYFRGREMSESYLSGISDEVIADRLAWYFGMYAGEGQMLAESRAIIVNLEDDGRVSSWLARGAAQNFGKTVDSPLPILTPVQTKDFVKLRRTRKDMRRCII